MLFRRRKSRCASAVDHSFSHCIDKHMPYNRGMKTLVLYTSKYGSTKQYAEWIAEELGTISRPLAAVTADDVAACNTLVIGCYVRMGKLMGAEFLAQHWDALQHIHVVLFSVAAAPSESLERAKWFEESVPPHIRAQITHVPLRGRVRNLDLKDRAIIAMPKFMLWLKCVFKPTAANKAALSGFRPFDAVRRDTLGPVIEAVRKGSTH